MGSQFSSVLWFFAVIAAIPLVLWMLKRTPLAGVTGGNAALKSVGVLALSASQRVVAVEVGLGDERRWLVLGVTPHSIQTLHTMAPQGDVSPSTALATPPFAQWLARFKPASKDTDAH
jgi:flagellar protein FliO/FliZ